MSFKLHRHFPSQGLPEMVLPIYSLVFQLSRNCTLAPRSDKSVLVNRYLKDTPGKPFSLVPFCFGKNSTIWHWLGSPQSTLKTKQKYILFRSSRNQAVIAKLAMVAQESKQTKQRNSTPKNKSLLMSFSTLTSSLFLSSRVLLALEILYPPNC